MTNPYAEAFKNQGNQLLQRGQYNEAIQQFTKALQLQKSAIYYSNRALCYLKLANYRYALNDTTEALKLDPSYDKNRQRHAEALIRLGRPQEAQTIAYELFNAEQTTKNRELLNEANKAADLLANFGTKVMGAANQLLQVQAVLCKAFLGSEFPVISSKERSESMDKADSFVKARCVVYEAAHQARQKFDEIGAKSLYEDVKFWGKTMPTVPIDPGVMAFYSLLMQNFRNACDALAVHGCQMFAYDDESIQKNREHYVNLALSHVGRCQNGPAKQCIQIAAKLEQYQTDQAAQLFPQLARMDHKFGIFIQYYQAYVTYKQLGSDAFKAKNFAQAITHFYNATLNIFDYNKFDSIQLDPFVALLFLSSQFLAAQTLSNVAMAHASMNYFSNALQNFNCATFLDVRYAKAHLRAANIYKDNQMFKEAEDSYGYAAAADPSQKLGDIIYDMRAKGKPYLRQDYYALIGVSKGTQVDSDEYKKAYKKACMKYHPDRFARDPVGKRFAEWKFRLIQEADTVLNDKQKKMIYDQGGDPVNDTGAGGMSSGFQGFSSAGDIGDIFRMFSGGAGGGMPGGVQFTVNGQPVDPSQFGGDFPGFAFGGAGAGGRPRGGRNARASGMPPGMGDIFSQFFGGL